jgi:mycofactocin precursor
MESIDVAPPELAGSDDWTDDDLVEDDFLVEEISIDGMCGVY